MSDPFVGEIRMVAFSYAPAGWALCQGQIMAISQNQALFALLGTMYGGNGQVNFALPNFSGRSPVGVGTNPGLSTITQAETGGNEQVALTQQQMPIHTHAATVTGGGAVTGQISVPATTTSTGQVATPANNTVLGPAVAAGRPAEVYSTAAANTTLAPFSVSLQAGPPTVTLATAGGSTPVPLRNPFLGTLFIIALTGIFPPRP